MKKRVYIILGALLLSLGITACGGGAENGGTSQEQVSAAETGDGEEQASSGENGEQASAAGAVQGKPAKDRAGKDISVPDEVETIVSLAPATTQVLCDLGLASKIAAVDTNSPEYAEGLSQDVVMFNMLEPDLEKLISLEPDIVFVSNLSSQGGADIYQAVRDGGVCVAEIPTADTIGDIKKDVRFISDCVGSSLKGKEIVEDMEAGIAEITGIGETVADKKTVLFEISPLPYLYSFGKGVYLNEMLELIGAKNVLEDQEGWLSVTEEDAVAANPDVILTSNNYSMEDPTQEILGRSGWENVTAVKEGAVYYIDNASSSLPNQHVIEALKEMAKAVYPKEYDAVD